MLLGSFARISSRLLGCRGLALDFLRRLLLDSRRCHPGFSPFDLLLYLWSFRLAHRNLYLSLALRRRHLNLVLPLDLALLLALFELLAALRCCFLIRHTTSLIFAPSVFHLLPAYSVLLRLQLFSYLLLLRALQLSFLLAALLNLLAFDSLQLLLCTSFHAPISFRDVHLPTNAPVILAVVSYLKVLVPGLVRNRLRSQDLRQVFVHH